MKAAFKKYADEKWNKRLKYCAHISAAICILLMLIAIYLMDKISPLALHILRGLTGAFAILFAILTTAFVYRIYRAYWKDKNKNKT